MSNCIEIHSSREINLLPDAIDIKAFREALHKAHFDKFNATRSNAPEDNQGNCFWWFVSAYDGSDTLLRVSLYRHSTFTWRSLRATICNCFAPFMKKEVVARFLVSDEFDGFKNRSWISVNLKTGEIK